MLEPAEDDTCLGDVEVNRHLALATSPPPAKRLLYAAPARRFPDSPLEQALALRYMIRVLG